MGLHEDLYNIDITCQYYYIKAFKLIAQDLMKDDSSLWETYLEFAAASAKSKYGYKAVFTRLLDFLYKPKGDLTFSHKLQEGLPELSDYYTVGLQTFKSIKGLS